MNVEGVLRKLEQLVAFDTQNPPREITADAAIFSWIQQSLGSEFEVDLTDHGQGRISMLAVRGAPSILFNSHLDTVPVIAGSRFPALALTRHNDRLYGRGACDIKGAAACLLEVAASSSKPMALLFTTDEEGANGCCVNEFVASGRLADFSQVVVTEPTECKAVLSHRGYLSVKGEFGGVPGHSSEQRALRDNAVHKLVNWAARAIIEAQTMEDQIDEDRVDKDRTDEGRAAEDRPGDSRVDESRVNESRSRRPCFNIGEVHGGIKSNVIADKADVHWSARLSPGDSNEAFLQLMCNLSPGDEAQWTVPFSGPPLPSDGMDSSAAKAFVERFGLATGPEVNFWTEASLFARAGTPAIVLGPGNIAQAHAIDEWVSIQQLEQALHIYNKLVEAYD